MSPTKILTVLSALGLGLGIGCQESQQKQGSTRKKKDDIGVFSPLPEAATSPNDNPTTPTKVALGKLLFFDPILSGHKDIACATCHHPDFGFAENLEISIGVNGEGTGSRRIFKEPNDIPFVKRNAQTVVNTAFNGLTNKGAILPEDAPMFWDLRTKSLEKQALEPIKAFEEMRGHSYSKAEALDSVVARLNQITEYRKLFKEVFGTSMAINTTQLAQALAAYERSLIGGNTRFDKYLRGDKNALSINELEGLNAFLKSGCAKCHSGPMLSDFKVHTLGVPAHEQLPIIDDGFNKTHAFRTPSLRNLRYTSPYMHNGTISTLQQVLEFYEDLSGGKIRNSAIKKSQIDPLIDELQVDFKDISLIIEFLSTLNDDDFERSIPSRVPSRLKVGGEL